VTIGDLRSPYLFADGLHPLLHFWKCAGDFPPTSGGRFATACDLVGQFHGAFAVAQWDIVGSAARQHFSAGISWGYWGPKNAGEKSCSEGYWDKSVQQFTHDLDEMAGYW